MVRLKQVWRIFEEYEQLRCRPGRIDVEVVNALSYLWADGIYSNIRLDR